MILIQLTFKSDAPCTFSPTVVSQIKLNIRDMTYMFNSSETPLQTAFSNSTHTCKPVLVPNP